METALLAHSALSLVRLAQASGPALERLMRGMRGIRMEAGVLQLAETGGGIPYIRLVAPAGAIALTQEEVIALAEAGQISKTALGLYMMMKRPPGGAGPPRKGADAEERVSKKIGIRRNVGPGQEKIPSASGAKKYRIPDFPPSITAVERGSIVEVKNVKNTVYITKQLDDLLAQAEEIGGRIELFTDAPIGGELLKYKARGLLLVHPIPP